MSAAPTSLPDTSEPMAAVRHYIESFNKGDSTAMAAMCANPMSILDGMARHGLGLDQRDHRSATEVTDFLMTT